MVSSTSALSLFPVCADNNDSPPAASPEAGREPDNALSFASRLNERRSQFESDKTARRPLSRLPDNAADTQEPQSADDAANAPETSASASEAATRTRDAESSEEASGKSDDSEDNDKRTRTDKAAAPTPAAIAPLTPDALNAPAFLAGLTVTPTAAIPTATPVTTVAPSGNTQVIAVVPANDKPASATTAVAIPQVAGANAANAKPTLPTVTPLIPTVAMDSRRIERDAGSRQRFPACFSIAVRFDAPCSISGERKRQSCRRHYAQCVRRSGPQHDYAAKPEYCCPSDC